MVETFGTAAQVVGLRDAVDAAAEGLMFIPVAGGGVLSIVQDGFAVCAALTPPQMTALAGALLAAAQSALTAETEEVHGHA